MIIAGVDEVGRGPLAGPVFASACILKEELLPLFQDLKDSKALLPKKREEIYLRILGAKIPFGVGSASVLEIDSLNILQASLLAMKRAVIRLPFSPTLLLVDGNQKIDITIPQRTIIRGDSTVPSISAASVIAKVLRDRLLEKYETLYPGYGFATHKGYGTRLHLEMIKEKGVLQVHRKTFTRNLI